MGMRGEFLTNDKYFQDNKHACPTRQEKKEETTVLYFTVLLSYNKQNSLILTHQQTAHPESVKPSTQTANDWPWGYAKEMYPVDSYFLMMPL